MLELKVIHWQLHVLLPHITDGKSEVQTGKGTVLRPEGRGKEEPVLESVCFSVLAILPHTAFWLTKESISGFTAEF